MVTHGLKNDENGVPFSLCGLYLLGSKECATTDSTAVTCRKCKDEKTKNDYSACS